MRNRSIIYALMAAALLGCAKEKVEEPLVPENGDYLGTVTVTYQDQPFDNEDIEVNFTPSEDGKSASVTICKIRFVPQMPVTIDVTIPDVNLSSTTEEILLSCDNVVPLALGGEYPRYLVTGLSGKLQGNELGFSLKFGDYPTVFKGVKK